MANNQRNGNRDDDNDTKKGSSTGKSGSHQGSKGGTGTTRAGEEKRDSKDRKFGPLSSAEQEGDGLSTISFFS